MGEALWVSLLALPQPWFRKHRCGFDDPLTFLGLQTGAMLTVRRAGKDFVQAKSPANTGSAHTVITAWAVEACSYVNGHLDHRGFFSPSNGEEHFHTSVFFSVGGGFYHWFRNCNKKSKPTTLHVKLTKEIVGVKWP